MYLNDANRTIAEQRLRALAAASPSSMRGRKWDHPFSNPGNLDAIDWLVLCGPVGELCNNLPTDFPSCSAAAHGTMLSALSRERAQRPKDMQCNLTRVQLRRARPCVLLVHVTSQLRAIVAPLMLNTWRGAGKYGLAGLLPPAAEEAVFTLFDVACELWRKEHTAHEAAGWLRRVRQALALIELHLPCTEQDLKLHNWLHLAEQIQRLGPNWVTSCFGPERYWGILNRHLGNKAHPEASIASGHDAMVAALHAQLRSGVAWDRLAGMETVQLTPEADAFQLPLSYQPPQHSDPLGVQMGPRPMELQLDDDMYRQLHANYLEAVSAYRAHWNQFIYRCITQGKVRTLRACHPSPPSPFKSTLPGSLVWCRGPPVCCGAPDQFVCI